MSVRFFVGWNDVFIFSVAGILEDSKLDVDAEYKMEFLLVDGGIPKLDSFVLTVTPFLPENKRRKYFETNLQ